MLIIEGKGRFVEGIFNLPITLNKLCAMFNIYNGCWLSVLLPFSIAIPWIYHYT